MRPAGRRATLEGVADDDREQTRPWGAAHRRFDVLTVCTANLCRSPIAEAVLRHELATLPGAWSVRSAGTDARAGRPVHPDSARALAEHDLALPEGWRSRQLRADDVARADLVLTANRAHRAKVLGLLPSASARVFTLRQFVRLLAAARTQPPLDTTGFDHPGEWLLASAGAARGLAVPQRPEDDDVADPIGRPYKVFRELADDLVDLAAAVSSAVPVLR